VKMTVATELIEGIWGSTATHVVAVAYGEADLGADGGGGRRIDGNKADYATVR
jgi:hypothetical protein